ncbi:hypothetical protein HQ563_04295 [bacterium]|nr:hypothetical protein [bacterium]
MASWEADQGWANDGAQFEDDSHGRKGKKTSLEEKLTAFEDSMTKRHPMLPPLPRDVFDQVEESIEGKNVPPADGQEGFPHGTLPEIQEAGTAPPAGMMRWEPLLVTAQSATIRIRRKAIKALVAVKGRTRRR